MTKLKLLIVDWIESNLEKIIKHNFESFEEYFICPGILGKEIDIEDCNIHNCEKCWKNVIGELRNDSGI